MESIVRSYIIPKGKHTKITLHRITNRIIPKFARKGLCLEFEAIIETPPYDIRTDADQHDYHKLIGIGLRWFTLNNNKDTALLAMLLPWHGGADNDRNGIGGVEPVYIHLKIKYKWKRKQQHG